MNQSHAVLSNYLYFAQGVGKITRTKCDWFWSSFSLVENWCKIFEANH